MLYVSVRGDINGDGLISLSDYISLNTGYRNNSLKNEYFYSADIDNDGLISIQDMLQVMQHVNGKVDIESDLKH